MQPASAAVRAGAWSPVAAGAGAALPDPEPEPEPEPVPTPRATQAAQPEEEEQEEEPAPEPAPAPAVADGSVWDALAECESGGNWSINTGNGYYGGLQISKSTWDGYGGPSGYPHQYSREQQIAVAERIQDGQGWDAWPTCARRLGLI